MPAMLAVMEAETRRIFVLGQSRQIMLKTLFPEEP
jgi:hypothetical protein